MPPCCSTWPCDDQGRYSQTSSAVSTNRRLLRSDSVEELVRRAEAAPVARLATVDAGGRPHLVPCCFAVSGDVAYSVVDHKPKRSTALRRLDNVAANPAVCL